MMVFLAFFFLLSLTNVVRSIPTDLDQNSQAIPEPAEEPSGNAPDGVLGFLSVASNPTDPTPDRVNIPTDPLNLGFNPPGGYISSAGDSSTTDSDGAGFKTPLVDTSWIADDPVLRPLADKVENCHSSSKQKREEATGYCPSGITQPTRGSSSQRPRNQDPPLRNGAVLSHRGTPKCNNGWTPSCCYNGIVRPISDGKGGIKFDYGICTKYEWTELWCKKMDRLKCCWIFHPGQNLVQPQYPGEDWTIVQASGGWGQHCIPILYPQNVDPRPLEKPNED